MGDYAHYHRRCAWPLCGVRFRPHDGRQRYCSPEHARLGRDARTRYCKHCHTQLPPVRALRRFCHESCRVAYFEERTHTPNKPVRLPILSDLPAGCQPTQVKRALQGVWEPRGEDFEGAVGESYGEVVRRIWCARYERCLAWVVAQNWANWDCSQCAVEEPDVPELKRPGSNWDLVWRR